MLLIYIMVYKIQHFLLKHRNFCNFYFHKVHETRKKNPTQQREYFSSVPELFLFCLPENLNYSLSGAK